jgi:hypothetical protein
MPYFRNRLNEIKETYNEIYLIVAPPRTASTAFTRVIWEHPIHRLGSTPMSRLNWCITETRL